MADLPTRPNSREEQYLADIAGLDVQTPACPYSRKEAYYEAIGERLDVIEEDIDDLEAEVEELKNNPDVVDIVPTYAALQAYDTSTLTDKDIIRVLADETHDGASTYYRWSAETSSFTYIGEAGDYYTKAQMDILLDGKEAKTIVGTSAPTTATAAENIGQKYYDSTNDKWYHCSAITAQGTDPETYTYTWDRIGGGFAGASVDNTTLVLDADMVRVSGTKIIFEENE